MTEYVTYYVASDLPKDWLSRLSTIIKHQSFALLHVAIYALLLTVGIETLRQVPDKVTVGHPGCFFYLLSRGVLPAVGDIRVHSPSTVMRDFSIEPNVVTSQISTYKSVGSCETTPIRSLHDSGVKSRMSSPSKMTRPELGS